MHQYRSNSNSALLFSWVQFYHIQRDSRREVVVVLLIKAKVSDPPADNRVVAPLICDSIMNQDDDDVKANCQMSLIHCY